MAETDWTELTGGLSDSSLKAGVTSAENPPDGGGTFVYGMNSLQVVTGARGLFVNGSGFAPTTKGGSIRGAVKRGVSGGSVGFSPFLFIMATGPDVTDSAYMLGLSDDSPSRISLVKGVISSGIVAGAPAAPDNTVLLRSTREVAIDEWVHLRLDAIANANGDVILQAYENDLDANPIGSPPNWQIIEGMEGPRAPAIDGFIDDSLGVKSGSVPFTSGRMGYGMAVEDVSRRAYFDSIEAFRNT